MATSLTMSITKMTAFLEVFEGMQMDKKEVLKSINIHPSVLESPDNKIPADSILRIVEEIVRLTGKEEIGLQQGSLLSRGFSNILGYILMNCNTLGEAAQKYCKYEKIVDETSITSIGKEGDTAVLNITIMDDQLAKNRQYCDYKLSATLSYINLLLGKKFPLREIHFAYQKQRDIAEYSKIFKCPVFFESKKNALVFDYKILDLPIFEPNRGLLELLEKEAEEILHKFESSNTYSKKVVSMILKKMQEEMPSIRIIAKELAVSERGLQLYLQKEGTSYMRLLNEVRKNRAIYYLKDRNSAVDEVAYMLGFSSSSAFHRAFKKWTSLSPSEFRNTKMNVE